MWIGTESGMARYDGHSWQRFTMKDGLGLPSVNVIFQDKEGVLWFGSASLSRGGVTRYDGKTWHTFTTQDGLAGWEVLDILQDVDGVFWLATENGVSRIESIDLAP